MADMLTAMGFDAGAAATAMSMSGNDVQRAVDLLTSGAIPAGGGASGGGASGGGGASRVLDMSQDSESELSDDLPLSDDDDAGPTSAEPSKQARWFWAGDSGQGQQDKWIEYDKAVSASRRASRSGSLGSDTITHSAVSPQTTAKLEAAFAAKETRVDVDAERFVDLSAPMAQARKDDPDRQRSVHRSSDGSTPANPSGFGAMAVPSAFAAPSPSPVKAKAKPPKMVVKVAKKASPKKVAGKQVERVEASKTGRASCKLCKQKIIKGVLRIGTPTMTQYGPGTGWYHGKCFPFGDGAEPSTMPGWDELSDSLQDELQDAVESGGPAGAAAAAAAPAAPAGAAADASGVTAMLAAAPKQTKAIGLLSEELPDERGVCKIEYCKVVKPSACMDCRGAIEFGAIRVGVVTEAFAWEGLQTRWLHQTCAMQGSQGGIQRLGQLQGWDRIGYDASVEIRTLTGEMLSAKKEKELEKQMVPLEDLQDILLQNLSQKQMVEILQLSESSCSCSCSCFCSAC